jgi:HK97 family phage prohead protease
VANTIAGYPIVFNAVSEDLGGFKERIAPSAIDRTLRERIDLRALAHHDVTKILARLTAKTLRVTKDTSGLYVEVDLPDNVDGDAVYASVRRGDLTSGSFGFQTLVDRWEDTRAGPLRTVEDALVRELSPVVARPAYPTTSITTRARAPLRGVPQASTVTARLAVALAGAVERRSLEYAMVKTATGAAVAHDEARRSLARFVEAKRKVGRRRPHDSSGAPMVWRSTRTEAGWRGEWTSRHLSVDDAMRRHRDVAQMIRKEMAR